MIHDLSDVRGGFDVDADVVVVGSGAGGAVAALNFARAGLRTVVLEAGPALTPADMTRDAPLFLARNYWEGGLRMIGGGSPNPAMQGRCLGGSTVVNSAIMLRLPRWVRRIWAAEDGLDAVVDDAPLDRAFDRVFAQCRVAPTPLAVMGRRNLIARDVLDAMGVPNGPLPRAVHGCEGCSDCITGCHTGAKQSVDRAYLSEASELGADVFTCSAVDTVDRRGDRATGVRGWVTDPRGRRKLARFKVRAPLVIVAAGVSATPLILLRSGIRGLVGKTLYAHMTAGLTAIMDEVVEPWIGATQGWGAISQEIRGLKYESLWAAPSLIAANWGPLGEPFYESMKDIRHAAVVACVYRARCRGHVRIRPDGNPAMKLWFDEREVVTLMRGLKHLVDGCFARGARYVTPSVRGVPKEITSPQEAEVLVSGRIRSRQLSMTYNHLFGSCRMSALASRGPVDPTGAVRGVSGLYLADGSVLPSPSAVNPQATIMALSDMITRRLAELPL